MTREHRVSRRVLLGAACALPVLSAVEGPLVRHPERVSGPIPPPARTSPEWMLKRVQHNDGAAATHSLTVTKWDRALAAYRHAETALAAMQGAPDALFDPCNLRFNRALSRLLRTPAPDLPALAAKLDLLVAHEAWELSFAAPSLAALTRDAHRLARPAV